MRFRRKSKTSGSFGRSGENHRTSPCSFTRKSTRSQSPNLKDGRLFQTNLTFFFGSFGAFGTDSDSLSAHNTGAMNMTRTSARGLIRPAQGRLILLLFRSDDSMVN